ncbi:AraC family transcriptional regulator [Pseudomonas sp. 5P_3.1_Bac2]|uniref:AraC family transcriptional regulator n=1 Tax=Pseudomonas sp. 5P_3.1_Bac2 TaxID=2971617 RepID=UPI0021C77959|nr:AraC family transcriptional regulator [Pseudomonas sp. 5P_3.1_Bac2]MCU1718605.1 AraC family transcriptional regulator [Pseudomonas sp. 5P_3.1_Bac2]
MSISNHDSAHTSVSVSITLAVLHAASRLGIERQSLLTACGLETEQLSDPDGRLPFATQERLWQQISLIDHPEPGLAIGQHLTPGLFSVLGYLLQSSPTLADALAAGLRYQRLIGEGGELQLHEQGDELQLLYRPLNPQLPATRTRVLALLAAWVQMIYPLLNNVRVRRVQFAYPQPADLAAYQACFACELQFDATDYGIVLPKAVASTPLLQANLPLQSILRQHAEALLARLPSESLSARVVSLLGEQLARGEPDRAELARRLKLSERTLQRRLADEGCNYQQLLNDTRQQLAQQHLSQSDLPAAEIALLLGYSEPSVFFRAFRQWTGLTPGEYRAQQRQAG